jgi:predicted HD phosphohydrolase
MTPLFYLMEQTKHITSNKKYHPEASVLEHLLQCTDIAFKETDDTDLIIAAMVHDVGKIDGEIDHDKQSAFLIKDYVSAKTFFLVENHMRVKKYLNGEMKKKSKCDFIINHPLINELVQLCRFDLMARNPNKKTNFDQAKIIERLNKKTELHFK